MASEQGSLSRSPVTLPAQMSSPDADRCAKDTDGDGSNEVNEDEASRQELLTENWPTLSSSSWRQDSPSPKNKTSTVDDDVRRCWICMEDETEDTPESSPWRAPCPCALKAHEECLLDWISEIRTPAGGPQQGRSKKILCPQCKSEIRVERARSRLVSLASRGNKFMDRLWTPGIIGVLSGSLLTTCMVYGLGTVYTIFGPEDAAQILGVLDHRAYRSLEILGFDLGHVARVLFPYGWFTSHNHWRLSIGLPLIPIALITSRIREATWLFVAFPVLFLGTTEQFKEWASQDEILPLNSAATFVLLPFIRSIYNQAYTELFGRMETRWNKALRPRGGDGAEDLADAPPTVDHHHHHHHDHVNFHDDSDTNSEASDNDGQVGEIVMDIPLPNLNLFGGPDSDDEDEDNRSDASSRASLPDLARPPDLNVGGGGVQLDLPGGGADDAFFAGLGDPDNANHVGDHGPHVIEPAFVQAPMQGGEAAEHWTGIVFGNIDVATNVMFGALFFPAAAVATGSLLNLLVPPSRLPANSLLARTGLVHVRWGRSVLGGCIFVVAKDMWCLWVKWTMVGLHLQRKVVDWDAEREKERENRRRKKRVGRPWWRMRGLL
ncbi:MAG: hypothetical protein M1814_001596 [Vezdaea aestivalis]|nr:MAG: hypothetical protein M1814_001596 [Vezdaea aestivalis]